MKSIITLLIANCLVAACIPIPVKHQEQITPALVGKLTLDDGRPARPYYIAASNDDRDRTCSRPGGRGVTDSLGRFRLPETNEERKIFWFTMMESFGMREYWLCARPAFAGAPGGAGLQDVARSDIAGHVRGDSLDCLQWRWRDTTRLSCNVAVNAKQQFPRGPDQILRGGSWTEGDVTGSYRVLFAQVGRWMSEARVVVQWVIGAPGTADAVRAQMDVPTRDSVELRGASLDSVDNAWRLRVQSARKTTWGNDIWLTYELRAPGVIHEIRDK